MTKLAYLECPTGLAGDMCLGALVHAGVPLDYLAKTLKQLGISSEYTLRAESVHRNGQQATKVYVELLTDLETPHLLEPGVDPYPTFDHSANPRGFHQPSPHGHHSHHPGDHDHSPPKPQDIVHQGHTSHTHTRHLPEIERLITAAHLPGRAEAWSLAVFRRLADAEGAVHGISPDQVHFHEVGATDAIVDIVGTCLGLDWLGIEELYCSPMPTGGGTIRAAHGRLPVPTPAVLKLWEMRQVPIYSNGIDRELVTPTGAAIATTLATQFGPPPPMILHTVGLGAGSRDLAIPNIVRLWIGEGKEEQNEGGRWKAEGRGGKAEGGRTKAEGGKSDAQTPAAPPQGSSSSLHPSSFILHPSQEFIAVLETQIDDLNPQAIGYGFEALFAAGAVDVFTQTIGMKKSRSGILLTVICHPEQVEACQTVLFRETTTLGIRHSMQQRSILHREMQTVETIYGAVRVKVARWEQGGAIANVQPEYDDCAQLARTLGVPWREVHRVALQSWYLKEPVSASAAVETSV